MECSSTHSTFQTKPKPLYFINEERRPNHQKHYTPKPLYFIIVPEFYLQPHMIASKGNCHQKHQPMPCHEESGREDSLCNELGDSHAINEGCCIVNVYVVTLQVCQDNKLRKLFRVISYIQCQDIKCGLTYPINFLEYKISSSRCL